MTFVVFGVGLEDRGDPAGVNRQGVDVCLNPWNHAVVLIHPSAPEQVDDLSVRMNAAMARASADDIT